MASAATFLPGQRGREILRRFVFAANAILWGHVIVRVGSLVLVPLFLKYWSASMYGEYLALFAAVGYVSSLDIGMQWAAVNRLTRAYARNDLREYRCVLHSTFSFYVALATVTIVLVAVLAWLLPLGRWIGLRQTNPTTATLVFILLATYVTCSTPMRLITASYQTMGNLARSQWMANGQQILAVLLSALALIFGGGMSVIAFLQVLTVCLIAVFVLLDLRRRFPSLLPGIAQARLSVLKELAHPGFLFALLVLGNLVAYQGSILLVSATLGGLAVALLSITKTMVDVVRQGLYSVNLALCPDIARMEALGEFETLRKIHRMTLAGVAAITLAVAASAWYEGPLIITVWTRGRIEPDAMLLRLFLVLMAFQTPWAASSSVATATNRHHVQAIGYFFSAVVGIGLAAALVHRLGTWAVPVGLTLGEALGCYHFVIQATCRIIGEPYRAFALRFWRGFVGVAAAVLTVGWLIHHLMPGPMLVRWAAIGIFTLAAAFAGAWVVWLTPEDRSLLLARLRPQHSRRGVKVQTVLIGFTGGQHGRENG
jgi:O-antigen/teichoic acid export membrane protein